MRKQYTKEFKLEVVKVAAQGSLSYEELGCKFGVDPSLIGKWVRKHNQEGGEAFRGHGNRAALEEENRRLEKENAELRLEREILKKAAAYFAKNLK